MSEGIMCDFCGLCTISPTRLDEYYHMAKNITVGGTALDIIAITSFKDKSGGKIDICEECANSVLQQLYEGFI